MRRLAVLGAVLAVVLIVPLAAARLPGTDAQEATPAAGAGFTLEPLGGGPSTEAPGLGLGQARVTFAPGFAETHRHVHPFDYVVVVESGSLAFTIEAGTLLLTRAGAAATPTAAEAVAPGTEVTVGPGDSFAGNRDVVWALERVVGDEPFVARVAFLGAPDAPFATYLDGTPTP